MVTVADLTVKISAEVADAQKGLQQTQAGLAAVETQAKLTGAQIDALAEKFAKAQGGSADQWRDIVKNIAPDDAFKSVGDGLAKTTQGAQAAATAAAAIATPTKAAATAATDLSKGFSLSESSIVRAGAALVGVGLNLSIIAGVAAIAHQAIMDMVDGQLALEAATRGTSMVFGQQAGSVQALAQAQTNAGDQAGTTTQHLQSLNDAAFLQSRYGFSTSSLQGLTSTSNRLSMTMGDDPTQYAARQASFRQFVEQGGSGLRNIGLSGDALTSARALGLGNEAAFTQGLTPAQQMAARAAQAGQAGAQANISAQDAGGQDLMAHLADAQKMRDQAASALHDILQGNAQPGSHGVAGQGPLQAISNFSGILGGAGELQQRGDLGLGPGTGDPNAPRADIAARASLAAADAELTKWTDALGTSQTELAKYTDDLAKLGLIANTSATRLLGFTGTLEDPLSIARGDVGSAAQAAVVARAIGPNPLIAKPTGEIVTGAQQTAEQAAYQQYVAERAQQALTTEGSANVDTLTQHAQALLQGPGLEGQRDTPDSAAAQRALDTLPRRTFGTAVADKATQASAQAQRAQLEASSQLQGIALVQSERQLSIAGQMATLRAQEITTGLQILDVGRQQADLQDRISVASRDNLTSRRALISAEQAALPASNAVSALNFQQQQLQLRAEVSQANVRRGGAPTEDIASLRTQMRDVALSQPQAELNQLNTGRAVEVVQQQRTGEDLARQQNLTTLEGQSRALQDQLIPLAAAQRLTQEQSTNLQASVDLVNLRDTAEVTAAAHRINEASALQLKADALQRSATDYAVGLNSGASAAERSAFWLDQSFQTLTKIAKIPALGNQVSDMIDAKIREVFAGFTTSGNPAPSWVAGAGR